MIRARLSNGDFLFGIDAENIKRLREGQPIMVDLVPMGGDGKIIITYGETLADVRRDLESQFGELPPPTTLGN